MYIIFGCYFCGWVGAYNDFNDNSNLVSESSDSVKEIHRGCRYGNILCEEKIKLFSEEEFLDMNGSKLYSRMVEIGKEYKKQSGKSVKQIASHTSKIKFTYDKKTFVKISDPDNDIKEDKTGHSWSVMDVKEIFPSDTQCLVSTRCVLYKENQVRVKEYVLSSHYDIMCSVGGQIGINTELH